MKANIIEIFNSIQGEGKYAGVRQVFVRFFECNMHCDWCDTPHSIGDTTRHYKEYTLKELLQEMDEKRNGSHSVSLTGGEPLLQADFIEQLLPELKKRNWPVHLETNGVLPKALAQIINDIDVVAMDIKMPSSTRCQEYWQEHKEFLKIAQQKEVFIKTVVTSDTDSGDLKRTIEIVEEIDPSIFFVLQPNTFELGNGVMRRCSELEKLCTPRLKNVRILPQAHKLLKVR